MRFPGVFPIPGAGQISGLLLFPALIFPALAVSPAAAAPPAWIAVSPDRRGFVRQPSGLKFTPWGFNYDHNGQGQLLEDYWETRWDDIAADFREMKTLGANVVRIHLQFGRFMTGPDKPNPPSLRQLQRLVHLAEKTGLLLDLTGLGCYHKKEVPAWYDALDEQQRWRSQAKFWEAVARQCANSPAIFCYDLMNEPVVPGGKKKRTDWLGPAFAGKHFVQFIALETRGRPRPGIARLWIDRLVTAIRRHDRRHLITVGLVPWSLDRPGLTSGFIPAKVSGRLDFLAVHLYPQKGKRKEALKILQGFAAVGKPVVVEETFPLKCSPAELAAFLKESRKTAAGFISFYWGQTPDELKRAGTLPAAITRDWLLRFSRMAPR